MINTLENLRLRAIALRSSVHNEHCLSAIELAGMCAKKTNELIDIINELVEVTNQIKVEYDAITEALNIQIGG